MREILFKAKRKIWQLLPKEQWWVEGYYCRYGHTGKEKHYIIPSYASDLYAIEIDIKTLCQFTGLTDKNKKRIWENDICDCKKRGVAFFHCIVKCNAVKARFDVNAVGCNFPITLDGVTDISSVNGLDYEIIGNIFDNPELLEL